MRPASYFMRSTRLARSTNARRTWASSRSRSREPLTSETIEAYCAIGVSRLLLRLGNNRGMNEAEEDIRRFAPATSV
jgi:hypothetical protein